MIVSTYQPYFAPFPGFFYKAGLSDVFVILDRVQFPQGTTWTTRNRFKNDQGTLWMTVPVWKKGLGRQRIDTIKICYEERWVQKHLTSLKNAYSHAPYLQDHLAFLNRIFATKFDRLIDLNLAVIRYLIDDLKIDTQLVLLSELGIQAKGNRLLIEICKTLNASCFLAQKPAAKYLNCNLFDAAGVELRFIRLPSIAYPQLWSDFIPNLSTLDLLLNCGPRARDILFRD